MLFVVYKHCDDGGCHDIDDDDGGGIHGLSKQGVWVSKGHPNH